MRFTSASRVALLASMTKASAAFIPPIIQKQVTFLYGNEIVNRFAFLKQDRFSRKVHNIGTSRWMSSVGNELPQIRQIDKVALEEIFDDIEGGGREETGYVVIDVRGDDEIAQTGKISVHAHTLPLPLIAQMGAFNMDDDDFEEAFGFAKPSPDETIVFSCKAGIRSMQAAQLAAMSGYSNLVNYSGGAMDWFS